MHAARLIHSRRRDSLMLRVLLTVLCRLLIMPLTLVFILVLSFIVICIYFVFGCVVSNKQKDNQESLDEFLFCSCLWPWCGHAGSLSSARSSRCAVHGMICFVASRCKH